MSADRKVAVITGAAQGIGRAISLRLARDGFDLALADLAGSKDKLAGVAGEAEALGARTSRIVCDVRKEADVYAMIDQAVKELGRVDVMIANAGIAPPQDFLDTTVETMDTVYEVNIRGVMFCYQAAAKQMIKQGSGGRLIAAASIAGCQGFPRLGIYSASKFAVRGLNQCAALELGKYGITANVYCPAIVTTPMWDSLDKFFTEKDGLPVGGALAQQAATNPLGRNSKPEDVANLVSFLAGPDAEYVSGASMHVTGAMQLS